ncbi:MAG: thioredoxin domain-containing protein [Polaromonas sp.]|nr:thioredoxin domain-containing protein [Gemmatimonadaceae bacterium]
MPAAVDVQTSPARAATHTDAVKPLTAGKPRRVMLGGVDLTGVGYDRGSSTAPVVMIDLSDFACPYCGEFSLTTYPAIEREYVKTGKVFFKYVPFVVGSFPHSAEATRVVECAAEQGAFWPMVTRVYEGQGQWRRSGDAYAVLSGIAGAAGLDTARIGSCYASRRTDVRTARASSIASDLGVRVTPSFIVNERPVQGALPIEEFRKVIDAALMVSHLNK